MNDTLRTAWARAQALSAAGQWEQATALHRQLVKEHPLFVEGWLGLSLALERLDRYRDALAAAITATTMPVGVSVATAQAVVQRMRHFEEGEILVDYIAKSGVLARADAATVANMAAAAATVGRAAESLHWLESALARDQANARAWFMSGTVHLFLGNLVAARSALERALTLQPQMAPAYRMLAELRSVAPGLDNVKLLRELLRNPRLAPRDEVQLAFALHAELDWTGDYAEAWSALEHGCKLKRRLLRQEPARAIQLLAKVASSFPGSGSVQPGDGEEAQAPGALFIVGMHRSGTSLLARMLSGHAAIGDAGESYLVTAQLRWAADHYCRGALDETILSRASAVEPDRLRRSVMRGLVHRAPERSIIIEKTNPNFQNAGFLFKAFPHSPIVHMVRDAVDTCFSNLRTLFTAEAPYSYDQIELADYYSGYHRLMAHWEAIAPGRLLHLSLADLARSPEPHLKRVVALCGLDYDPLMLDLSRSEGQVTSASAAQVRGGLRDPSKRAWMPYSEHLGPLLDRLSANGLY